MVVVVVVDQVIQAVILVIGVGQVGQVAILEVGVFQEVVLIVILVAGPELHQGNHFVDRQVVKTAEERVVLRKLEDR